MARAFSLQLYRAEHRPSTSLKAGVLRCFCRSPGQPWGQATGSEASCVSGQATKSRCACEWGKWAGCRMMNERGNVGRSCNVKLHAGGENDTLVLRVLQRESAAPLQLPGGLVGVQPRNSSCPSKIATSSSRTRCFKPTGFGSSTGVAFCHSGMSSLGRFPKREGFGTSG